ncbi:MAG: ZIP family metal transporter [Weeksellaceae bacterium]
MFEIVILFLSVIIGAFLGYVFSGNRILSKFLLTFSGAFFLGVAVLEIFPIVYESHNHSIGLFVLAGLFFQMLVESLSKGAEHGHVHFHEQKLFPMSIFIGLFLHSFFEGIPVKNQESHHLLWAIFIHNIPISMILYGAIAQMKTSIFYRFIFMFLFAIAGPLGIVFGDTVFFRFQTQTTAFVAGIFIHIATVILFESNESHKFKLRKIVTVLLGFALAFLISLLGH